MKAALLAALAEGAGGDGGRRAVETLARAVGLDAGAPARDIAEAAKDPARRDAVREWGEAVADLLAADPRGVAGAVARAMERYAPGSETSWYDGDHADFRGGVFLREVVGVQVVIQQGWVAVPEAMAGLPPRPGGFTGRERETADLLRALDPAGAQSSESLATLVAAVSGLGGIGKTALAVETAHLARERGWFPGGVLFIDLHGYDQEPVTADRALQALLRALGTPPEHIPTTADERVVLYRSTLAARADERGPVLVLADNASSPDQVRPLLPGDARHHVLVTSRDRLPQLGARLVPVDQLSLKEAYELLDRALRIADPHDSRVVDDPGTAERPHPRPGPTPAHRRPQPRGLCVEQPRTRPAGGGSGGGGDRRPHPRPGPAPGGRKPPPRGRRVEQPRHRSTGSGSGGGGGRRQRPSQRPAPGRRGPPGRGQRVEQPRPRPAEGGPDGRGDRGVRQVPRDLSGVRGLVRRGASPPESGPRP